MDFKHDIFHMANKIVKILNDKSIYFLFDKYFLNHSSAKCYP